MGTLRCTLATAFVIACSIITTQTAWAKDAYARPAGINPTSATIVRVFADARKAYGIDTHYNTRLEEGRVTAWGLKGTFKELESGENFKSIIDLGIVSWQNGQVDGQLWRRNENGLVVQMHDERNSYDLDAEAVWSYALGHQSEAQLLGETGGPGAAYVVEQHRQGWLHPRWLFFDKSTHVVTREEIPFWDARLVYTFSEFKKTGPYLNPWREHYSDGVAQNDQDFVTTSVHYDQGVSASDFAMPLSNDKLVQFPAGTNVVVLPTRTVDKGSQTKIVTQDNGNADFTRPGSMTSTYVVQGSSDPHLVIVLTIGGRGYDFFLDTGASGIFIDSDAADKLGLKTFGPVQQTQFGKWAPAFASVPEIRVGDITMNNIIVHTLPGWHLDARVGTEILGLVGYDFIANAVLKIDYEKDAVTATNPFMFVPPSDAMAVPATFDNGVPYIPVQIGQTSAEHFIVDTGSPNCFLFAGFAQAHQSDVKDQGKGTQVNHVWLPYASWGGVGGTLTLQATEVKNLTIASASFDDWLMFVDQSPQDQDINDDGLIGYDFLKYFTVYLDYPQNQLFLAPNSLAKSKVVH